jgi:NifU-like protein
MAKEDMVGGSLWEKYSGKVEQRMLRPAFMGDISQEEADKRGARLVTADYGAEVCGDAVRLYWLVDTETDTILDAKFRTFGCGTAIASSDVMAEMCIGKTVDEVLEITNLDVEGALRDEPDKPAIPPQKMHCSVMAYDVLKKAASIYKGVDMASLEAEDIVCQCARVSLKTIRDVIRINDLKTVEDVIHYTKAGAFCKSCIRPGGHAPRKYYLENILREVRLEMEKETAATHAAPEDFTSMTLIQKHRAVETVLDREVRGFLARDGGDLEILDMKEQGGLMEIFISYSGACQGCPSGKTFTLQKIEATLREKLTDTIRVVVT